MACRLWAVCGLLLTKFTHIFLGYSLGAGEITSPQGLIIQSQENKAQQNHVDAFLDVLY